MKITSINDYKDIHQEKGTVLVLGYFDALHRGHKVLFDKARQIADDKQLEVAVLTFNESPQLTFQRYTDDLLLHITAPQRRCDLFEAYGTDQLYLTDFNSDFARTSSDDFIARYIKRLKAQEVVVGFDYKFGHHRTDADYLSRNFSGNVHVIEEQQSDGEKISSTRVRQLIQEGKVKELSIIVKADVQGSVEAVKQSLLKIENDEVNVKIVHGAVGAVSESDVMLAEASKAIIVAFNTGVDQIAADNAKRDGIEIKQYDIIYDAIEDIERAMRGMRAPKYRDVDTGEVEVREVYKISSAGTIAGSLVTSGTIKRDGKVRVIRNGKQIADVKLANLKRFKDEVKEVSSGYECGISLDGWDDIQAGDILQAYVVEEYRD